MDTRNDVMTRGLSRAYLAYLYRILGVLCALAAARAVLLWLTGGFRVELAGPRISSQRPRNALVISLFCAMLMWLLTFSPHGRHTFRDEWSRWRHWYISTHWWRGRAWHIMRIFTSALAIAAAAIAIDI